MGWKEFVASVVGSLAWPLVLLLLVTIVLFNFRAQLRALIARMKSVKGAGVEATFTEQLEEVKDTAEALLEGANEQHLSEVTAPDRTEPTATIIEAWKTLQELIRDLYLRARHEPEVEGTRVPPVTVMLDELLRMNVIDRDFRETVVMLRGLRNEVAHGRHRPTSDEARAYMKTVTDTMNYAVISSQEYLSDRPLPEHRT